MASYPAALWVPSTISSSTVLEAVLLTEAADEIDAIELELGIDVHGSSGSLRDRLNMFMDADGQVPYYQIKDALSSGERKSLRAGTLIVETDNLSDDGFSGNLQVTFAVDDVPATTKGVIAFVEMQTLAADLSDPSEPALVCFSFGTGTTTTFDVRVCDGTGNMPAPGTSFILHWIVVERNFHTSVAF